ncbi:hypothetical protein VUR80DRAFT_529 [Thermomyces stellatus]
MSADDDGPAYPPPPDLVLLAPAEAPPPLQQQEKKRAHGVEDGRGGEPAGRDDMKRRREGRRGYTRTGQACDRCKVGSYLFLRAPFFRFVCRFWAGEEKGLRGVFWGQARKVKCDGLPGGCSPCATAGVECFVTDRISGRTERRGYLQDLERERERMVAYIRDLEGLIAARTELRVRPSPWTAGFSGVGEEGGEWEQFGEVVVERRGGG